MDDLIAALRTADDHYAERQWWNVRTSIADLMGDGPDIDVPAWRGPSYLGQGSAPRDSRASRERFLIRWAGVWWSYDAPELALRIYRDDPDVDPPAPARRAAPGGRRPLDDIGKVVKDDPRPLLAELLRETSDG